MATNEVPACPAWLLWLSGAIPLAYFIAGASGFLPFYQDAVLVGSAAELGIGPAPGGCLSALLASLLTLLPIGPLSFRVACVSGLCVAYALALFARATFHSLVGLGVRRSAVASALSLAASWTVAATPAVFHTATHANVFALAWLFTLLILDAIVRYELSEPTEDLRLLNFAAFVQGLSFANHYVLALLTLPAAAPTLGRVFARRGFIGLMGHAALPLFGFSAYAYVPIRAAQHPSIDFSEASQLSRLFSTLSAEPFWARGVDSELSMLDQALAIIHALGPLFWPLLSLGALGVLSARKVPGLRRFAVIWALLFVVPLVGTLTMIRPGLSSDRFGALVPCAFGLAALSALGLGLSTERFARLRQGPLAVHGARALALLSLIAFLGSVGARSDAQVDVSDALNDLTLRALPEGALVLTHDPDTLMRALALEAEEHTRPDVSVVLLSPIEPSPLERLVETRPELSAVLRDVVVRGGPSLPSLQTLAAERPLFFDLDGRVLPELYPTLVSDGFLSRVLADGSTQTDERMAAQRFLPRLDLFRARLAHGGAAPEILRSLARRAFFQGLQTASLGDRASANHLLSLAQALAPDDPRTRALRKALQNDDPIDVVRLGGFSL